MSDIQRWEIGDCDGGPRYGLEEDTRGRYVLYEDHVRDVAVLRAQLAKAEAGAGGSADVKREAAERAAPMGEAMANACDGVPLTAADTAAAAARRTVS